MQEFSVKFEFEKETKNTRKYGEVPEPGQPPRIGTLYLQKWVVGSVHSLTVTVKEEK